MLSVHSVMGSWYPGSTHFCDLELGFLRGTLSDDSNSQWWILVVKTVTLSHGTWPQKRDAQ